LGAAFWLKTWARSLREEMRKQNVEFNPAEWDPGGWPTDSDKTISLKLHYLRELIRQMDQQRAELLRFAERPRRKSVRRAPRGFT
jgi:hypothetical protein